MKRIHLFEWEDLQWFPKSLRNYGTDFLQFLSNKTSLYKPVVPLLAQAMKDLNQNQILDLASGGGGGWQSLSKDLNAENTHFEIGKLKSGLGVVLYLIAVPKESHE